MSTGGSKALKEGRSMAVAEGRVKNVQFHPINPHIGLGFISGLVCPQTRVNEKPYFVWVSVHKNTGVVHKADCHCIAGLSGICKHVAALLYKVSDAVKEGHTKPGTSTLQTWHQPVHKKLKTSSFMSDIKTPKASSSMKPLQRKRRDESDPRAEDKRVQRDLASYNLDRLADISNGQSAVLLYSAGFRQEAPLKQKPDISHLGFAVDVTTNQELMVPTVESAAEHSEDFESFLSALTMSETSQVWLAKYTALQHQSDTWHNHRRGRLTASNMGKVLRHVDSSQNITGATHSLVATIMSYYPSMDGDRQPQPIRWGREHEAKALERYKLERIHHHKKFSLQATGLWVSCATPYIAASPDSLVECSCCGTGVVEVKNPWTNRHYTVTEFAKCSTSCIKELDGKLVLDEGHDYYTQIQAQMYCTGAAYGDFVLMLDASKDNFFTCRVPSNTDFMNIMCEKAHTFMSQVIYHELKNRNVKQKMTCK